MKNRSGTPSELLMEIVKEKQNQLPEIMKELEIDCWIVFLRETASSPDPVQNLAA